jgi:hypothetical protein
MPPEDAVVLENWYPTTIDCEIRGGQEDYATTITGTVETLAVYTPADGVEEFFAASDTDVYDISSSGAASAQSLTVTDGKFQYLNMGDGSNEWLMMFNGVDAPKYYNGTTWTEVTGATSPALTGVTATNVISACTYQGRLFLIEKDKMGFWYLPPNAVGGAATYYDLSPFAGLGGYVMWAAVWTYDAGDGLDDLIVFMTSQGQALIYTGVNPGSSTLWSKVGTYYLGKPLGRRSFIQFGADLLAITQNGVYPIAEGVLKATIDDRVAVTDKVKRSFNDAARNYYSNFGWEAVAYPIKNAILFNVPVNATTGQEQYVMNTVTGSWCKFTSWGAQCFCVFNNELYYGGSTVVQKAWTGRSDDGANIVAYGKAAFNHFGNATQSKRWVMFRPMIQTNGALSYLTDLDVDFKETDITGVADYTPAAGGVWDTGTWDSATWTGSLDTIRRWTSPDADIGYYAAGKLKVETKTVEVRWVACDYVYETGGVVG